MHGEMSKRALKNRGSAAMQNRAHLFARRVKKQANRLAHVYDPVEIRMLAKTRGQPQVQQRIAPPPPPDKRRRDDAQLGWGNQSTWMRTY